MLGDAPVDIWACGGGGCLDYIILIKTFVVQLLIKMLRVVDKIIIQGYLENTDRIHVFFKKIGSLINSLREKNSHENSNVKKVYTNKLHN